MELIESGKVRELRIGNIGGTVKGWAVINSRGRFGDEIVAADMVERDAETCLFALALRDKLDAVPVIATDA